MNPIPIRPRPEGSSQSGRVENNDKIRVRDEDPYKHLEDLGDGAYGIVDKVERNGKVYARKKIRVTRRNQEQILKDTKKEFDILKRLNHRHIIQVVEIFQCKDRLRIIMSQVADTDLKEYMERLDKVSIWDRSTTDMALTWPGCLIQAIDYLHEMRVKHRDLKPANILVQNGKVLIADFGVSKDLIDEETTASLTYAEPTGTPMYWAPEIMSIATPQRRGRAVDIFALGCIFLEIISLQWGLLFKFANFREINGSRAYGRCQGKLLLWMNHLWAVIRLEMRKEKRATSYSFEVIQLAYLMLDPNPKTRITARQLVAILETEGSSGCDLIARYSCDTCRSQFQPRAKSNIPLHSVFKPIADLELSETPKDELKREPLEWEGSKRVLLKEHMWW